MPERLAFDYSKYQSLHPQLRNEIVALDLAALVVEAGIEDLKNRVWPFRYQLRGERVICPEMGNQDISNYFSVETSLDRQETRAGLKLRQALISQPGGSTVVWLSPPNQKYSEGRITVGMIDWQNNLKVMHCYGIVVDFSKDEFIDIAKKFSDFCQPAGEIELRSHVFVFSSSNVPNSWHLVKRILPLGEIWQAIENNEVELRRERAIRDAQTVVSSMPTYLGFYDPVRQGAYLEEAMQGIGYKISGSSCGLLNSDLLHLSPRRVLNSIHGVIRNSASEVKVYVKKCGVCGEHIGKHLTPGESHCPHCGALFPKLC